MTALVLPPHYLLASSGGPLVLRGQPEGDAQTTVDELTRGVRNSLSQAYVVGTPVRIGDLGKFSSTVLDPASRALGIELSIMHSRDGVFAIPMRALEPNAARDAISGERELEPLAQLAVSALAR